MVRSYLDWYADLSCELQWNIRSIDVSQTKSPPPLPCLRQHSPVHRSYQITTAIALPTTTQPRPSILIANHLPKPRRHRSRASRARERPTASTTRWGGQRRPRIKGEQLQVRRPRAPGRPVEPAHRGRRSGGGFARGPALVPAGEAGGFLDPPGMPGAAANR